VSIWLAEDADLDDELLAETVKSAGFVLKEVRRAQLEAEPAT
jgi:Arc/MetJ family transcription regulator